MSHWFIKLFVVSFLLVSSSDCCLNKFKEIQRKLRSRIPNKVEKSTTVQPAVLYQEPVSEFSSYASTSGSDLYIEVEEDANGNYRILTTERLPPIMDQKLDSNSTKPLNITLTFLAENVTLKAQLTRKVDEDETNNNTIDYGLTIETANEVGTKSDDMDSQVNETTVTNETAVTNETTTTVVSNADEVDEEGLTEEDRSIRMEWGGECTSKHWKKCIRVRRLLAPYSKPKDPKKTILWMDIDCSLEKILCMRNGWTINRCHMVCMSKCNKEMQDEGGWEKYVSLEGECPY